LGQTDGDVPAATAILDRFLQHATIINITAGAIDCDTAATRKQKKYKARTRSTGDDCGLSPPEDTEPVMALSSDSGVHYRLTLLQ